MPEELAMMSGGSVSGAMPQTIHTSMSEQQGQDLVRDWRWGPGVRSAPSYPGGMSELPQAANGDALNGGRPASRLMTAAQRGPRSDEPSQSWCLHVCSG